MNIKQYIYSLSRPAMCHCCGRPNTCPESSKILRIQYRDSHTPPTCCDPTQYASPSLRCSLGTTYPLFQNPAQNSPAALCSSRSLHANPRLAAGLHLCEHPANFIVYGLPIGRDGCWRAGGSWAEKTTQHTSRCEWAEWSFVVLLKLEFCTVDLHLQRLSRFLW